MFLRDLCDFLEEYKKFPSIAILGPRQSGKTTLAKISFPNHAYVSLDDDAPRAFAQDDPERFLKTYENEHGVIIDEFQYAPKIVSYVKLAIDRHDRQGYYILTGSQNFLANQAITESLAGRVGILSLLPLSLHELQRNGIAPATVDEIIFNGGYPRLYDKKMVPEKLYPSYIQSYVERDIRQLINVGNLSTFQQFVTLCAGRIGQLLNMESIAVECGVTFPTIRQWLSILEASYIIFFLQPHFRNFNKRLVKTPKLYFFDTGLACSLLRITDPGMVAVSPFRGALFESLILSDLYKQYANRGERPGLYFWRDQGGAHEVDCIIDEGNVLHPVEIKSGQTIVTDFFKGLDYWNQVAQADPANGFVVYGGAQTQERRQGMLVGFPDAAQLIERIKR